MTLLVTLVLVFLFFFHLAYAIVLSNFLPLSLEMVSFPVLCIALTTPYQGLLRGVMRRRGDGVGINEVNQNDICQHERKSKQQKNANVF